MLSNSKCTWHLSGYAIKSTVLTMIVLFASAAFGQVSLVSEKYTLIKPGVSTRKDVEKVYGSGKSDDYFVKYNDDQATIFVTYSSEGCDSRKRAWGVPAWTVEEISFDFGENSVPLNEIILDRSRFKKSNSHVIGAVTYLNEDLGILIEYYAKFKTVQNITLSIGRNLRKGLACRK